MRVWQAVSLVYPAAVKIHIYIQYTRQTPGFGERFLASKFDVYAGMYGIYFRHPH